MTGQVRRGQVSPADRVHLRAWLARFAGREDAAFAVEACTGWRYVADELALAGVAVHLAEPADTAFARGRKRHAKTDLLDSVWLAKLAERGMLRASFIPSRPQRQLRDLTRYRRTLTRERTREKQRAEKLPEAQIKLSVVISDIFGA